MLIQVDVIYVIAYETIKSIANRAFEESGQTLVPKSKGGICYPVLQDEHIQWLLEKLDGNPDITLESLHHQLNEAFQFPRPVSSVCFKCY